MATCKHCDRKGWFLKLDNNGLCTACQPIVIPDVIARHKAIQRSLEPANRAAGLKTRVGKCDIIVEHAKALLRYERKGINTTSPLPSEFITEYQQVRRAHIREAARSVSEIAKAKADVASSHKTKANALAAGLAKIHEMGTTFDTMDEIRPLLGELSSMIHKTRLDGFLHSAAKAEFKKNRQKALDQYQEALYFVRNDDVPDEEQKDEIQFLEAKIAELSRSDES